MTKPVELPPPPHPDPLTDPLSLAIVAAVCEQGSEAGNPEELERRTGFFRAELDRRYSGFEAGLLDTYERFVASFERVVGAAFNTHDEWTTSLRASAYAAGDWMESNPEATVFGVVGVLKTKNEFVRIRREEIAAFCGELIAQGRHATPDPDQIPEGAELVAIGSIFHLLAQRLQEEDVPAYEEMVPQLMYGVVRTYLGDEAAERELTLPRPPDHPVDGPG
jgi:hypothetical protein